MKSKTITIKMKKLATYSGVDLYPNNRKDQKEGVYLQPTLKYTKPIKDDFIYSITNKRRVMMGVLDKGTVKITLETNIKELEKLLKIVKSKKKRLGDTFFVNFNPELSFFIRK